MWFKEMTGPNTSFDANGQSVPIYLLEIHGEIRWEIWIWIRISGLIITPNSAALSASNGIERNQKTAEWKGGGRGGRQERRKKEGRGEESGDQSWVWDYVCSDNILHPTHPHRELLPFRLSVSRPRSVNPFSTVHAPPSPPPPST